MNDKYCKESITSRLDRMRVRNNGYVESDPPNSFLPQAMI